MKKQRIINEIKQYGGTPSKLVSRFGYRKLPIIMANSIPKSGTNLLLRSLYLMPALYRKMSRTINNWNEANAIKVLREARKGQIVSAHLKYSEDLSLLLDALKIKHILIVRDPRDIAVSNFIYITYKDKSHRLHNYYANELRDDDERLSASINGVREDLLPDKIPSLSLLEHIVGYQPWFKNKNVLIAKFEELVGENGGGDKRSQIRTLNKICEYIGIEIKSKEVNKLADDIFNPSSRTFVKGRIGTWSEFFSDDHKILFKNMFGQILIDMGYEDDYSW